MYPEWIHRYDLFALWILNNLGPRPDGHTLDRSDNNGHYEPNNLKWSNGSEQSINKRAYDDRYITQINGKYRLRIPKDGSFVHIGYFDNIELARLARDN